MRGHSSLERVHVQIPRPGPRSRPQRHPAPRRHQSWRSRIQQDSVSTLVSGGQRARRQTRRRQQPTTRPKPSMKGRSSNKTPCGSAIATASTTWQAWGADLERGGVITGGVVALRRPQHPIREPNHRLLTRRGVFESTLNSPLSHTVSGSVRVIGPFRAPTLGASTLRSTDEPRRE